jgi:hypothetical protein
MPTNRFALVAWDSFSGTGYRMSSALGLSNSRPFSSRDVAAGEDNVDCGADVEREEIDRDGLVPWARGVDRNGDVNSGVVLRRRS